MTNQDRIRIAKSFVAAHKNENLEMWSHSVHRILDYEKLLEIYHNLVGGVYGEVVQVDEHMYEVEINSDSSHTGLPLTYLFEGEDYRED